MGLMNKSKVEVVYDFRRSMVADYLRIRSYRKTAGLYSVNPKTVVKWVKRYKENGLGGLRDLPRIPRRPFRKVTPQMERELLRWRDRTGFGARSEFLGKAFTYQLYFNLVRKNSYKDCEVPPSGSSRLPTYFKSTT